MMREFGIPVCVYRSTGFMTSRPYTHQCTPSQLLPRNPSLNPSPLYPWILEISAHKPSQPHPTVSSPFPGSTSPALERSPPSLVSSMNHRPTAALTSSRSVCPPSAERHHHHRLTTVSSYSCGQRYR
ncbi:hypothetical protein EX30DRAFT_61105 [Ascodesmis nigricans]|uniref:Uncharacterized protein n=1 Tax=Ascodesmis nigricans TaxID=341454 RepID=A0A4S2MUC0_9PEZI|nr:hypothetical protein EX30DRAFT_61105 [Ascodesmis nigricans]